MATEIINWALSEDTIKKVEGYLGIAQKAGKVSAGDMAVLSAISKNKAKLVVLAQDVSPKVVEEINKALSVKKVTMLVFKDKLALGLMVGKSRRGALAVTDAGLANAILKSVQKDKP